jgi:hypothetical protein
MYIFIVRGIIIGNEVFLNNEAAEHVALHTQRYIEQIIEEVSGQNILSIM